MDYLQCESKDGGVLDLLEVEEESNLLIEGAPSARLREKEPQQVLDPVNCLPVHLVTKHLHVEENTLFNIVMGDGLGRRI